MTYRAHGTGSLQRIRPGIWRSQIKAPDGRRLSATHHVDTKRDAQAAHDRFRARIEGGDADLQLRVLALEHQVAELLQRR